MSSHPIARLSKRELQVAALVLAHPKLSYEQIGKKLVIGPRTVRCHVASICSKLSRDPGFSDMLDGLDPRAALFSWLKAGAVLE